MSYYAYVDSYFSDQTILNAEFWAPGGVRYTASYDNFGAYVVQVAEGQSVYVTHPGYKQSVTVNTAGDPSGYYLQFYMEPVSPPPPPPPPPSGGYW
jgi:hypothetical protein